MTRPHMLISWSRFLIPTYTPIYSPSPYVDYWVYLGRWYEVHVLKCFVGVCRCWFKCCQYLLSAPSSLADFGMAIAGKNQTTRLVVYAKDWLICLLSLCATPIIHVVFAARKEVESRTPHLLQSDVFSRLQEIRIYMYPLENRTELFGSDYLELQGESLVILAYNMHECCETCWKK